MIPTWRCSVWRYSDIKRETLDQYDMSQLRELKRWIHQKKVEARKAREKRTGEQQANKMVVEEPLQIYFSFE